MPLESTLDSWLPHPKNASFGIAVTDAELCEEGTLKDTNAMLQDLQAALQQAKEDLAPKLTSTNDG